MSVLSLWPRIPCRDDDVVYGTTQHSVCSVVFVVDTVAVVVTVS